MSYAMKSINPSVTAGAELATLKPYSHLLEALYASLWQEKGMDESLTALQKYFNCCSATLMALQNQPRQLKYGWAVGTPEKFGRWYIEHDMVGKDPSVDLFINESPKKRGFVASSEYLGDLPLVDCVDEAFRPWLTEEAIVDTTGLVIPSSEEENLLLVLQRNETAGRFTERELEQLNLLAPHIKQTVQLFLNFYRQRSQSTSLQIAINSLPQPTIILNSVLQVLYINGAAEKLISNHKVIEIKEEYITIQNAEVHNQFMFHALNLATRATFDIANELNISIAVPSKRSNVLLTLSPMFDQQSEEKSRGVLLQLFDTQSNNFPNAERIQEALNLTSAETEVCVLLSQGYGVVEIAQQRKVSVNTVREQLRRVYKKTRYTRQSELVTAILRLN